MFCRYIKKKTFSIFAISLSGSCEFIADLILGRDETKL